MGEHVEHDATPETAQVVRFVDRALAMNPFDQGGTVS